VSLRKICTYPLNSYGLVWNSSFTNFMNFLKHPKFQLRSCQWRDRKLSDFMIRKICICGLKMNKSITSLERTWGWVLRITWHWRLIMTAIIFHNITVYYGAVLNIWLNKPSLSEHNTFKNIKKNITLKFWTVVYRPTLNILWPQYIFGLLSHLLI